MTNPRMNAEYLQSLTVHAFGSPSLDKLHHSCLLGTSRGGNSYEMTTYQRDAEYIVDHGEFFTLNRIFAGRVTPSSDDVPPDVAAEVFKLYLRNRELLRELPAPTAHNTTIEKQ